MRAPGREILFLGVAGAEAFSSPTAFGLVRGRALAFPISQPAPLSLRLPKLDDGTLVKGVVMMAKACVHLRMSPVNVPLYVYFRMYTYDFYT